MTDNTRALLEQILKVLQMAADGRNIGNPEVGIAAFPLLPKIRAELAKPPTPAWHDAPTEPGLWVRNGDDRVGVYSISEPLIKILKGSAARWYGPIPQDGEKS